MNAMIETSRPFGTDGTTYGFEASRERNPLTPETDSGSVRCGTHGPLCPHPSRCARPAVAELAAVGAGPSTRRVTSRAHKAPLTDRQWHALYLATRGTWGRVYIGRGSENTTAATIRALANKGYGRTLTASEAGLPGRRHEVAAFEINDLGRRALAEHEAAS